MRFGLVLAVLMAMAGVSHAEDALLFVSPLRVEIAPAKQTAVLTVTNKSSKTKHYRVELTDQQMNADGVTEGVDTFPYSAKNMLRFMPRRLTLEPGQRQVVRVMARRPANLPDGDYHTHLLFEEEQPAISAATSPTAGGFKMDIGAVYGVGIPVIVQQGTLTGKATLTSATYAPAAKPGQADAVTAAFLREGNSEASAYLVLTDASGVQVATPRILRLYREVGNVAISMPLTVKTPQFPLKLTMLTDNTPQATVLAEKNVGK
ncbi:MAG: hypothetical protein H6922_06425 [Pseudomonadaceae bacterium]|nr:hypothetical protein [Pseudomonadaceae bacterium]